MTTWRAQCLNEELSQIDQGLLVSCGLSSDIRAMRHLIKVLREVIEEITVTSPED